MRSLPFVLALVAAAPVWARDEPRFCPTRPSLGESGCVTEPGHVHLEGSVVDWTLDDDQSERQDTVLIGDAQARIGITSSGELQLGWSPYGHVRSRDKATAGVERAGRVGDVRIGYRQNLRNPDGKGLSFALEPFATLPVGRSPVGAGTWGAGVVLPVTYDLSDKLNVALTNEVDELPDEDGAGRHFGLNEVVGIGYALTDTLTAVAELQLVRDADPARHRTQLFTAGSLAWQPKDRVQLDVLVGAGLNHDAPDIRVLSGGAVLF